MNVPRFRLRWSILPIISIGTFVALYAYATTLYPGGSKTVPSTVGFSWQHNYWCDLLDARALNGQPNAAAPVAMLAMALSCPGLIAYCITLPRLFAMRRYRRWLVQYCGTAAMLVAPLIASRHHDVALNIACLLAALPIVITLLELYRARFRWLFGWGIGAGVLMAVCQVLYQTKWHLAALPVVQKITFAAVLIWLGSISWQIHRADSIRR